MKKHTVKDEHPHSHWEISDRPNVKPILRQPNVKILYKVFEESDAKKYVNTLRRRPVNRDKSISKLMMMETV